MLIALDKLDFIKGKVGKQGKAARDVIRFVEDNLGKNIELKDTPVNVNVNVSSKCPYRYKSLIKVVINEKKHTTLVTLDAALIEWCNRNDITTKTPHQVDAMLFNNVVKVDKYAERGTGQLWTPPSSRSKKRPLR